MEQISLLLAFAAGLLSFLSPCVLPLVPAYVGHLAGTTASQAGTVPRRHLINHALSFVAGFSLVFIAFWVSIGLAFEVLREQAPLLRQAGGVVLIVMGLNLLGVIHLPWLYRDVRFQPTAERRPSLTSSLMVGTLFAAGWTPCIGPVLGGIIGLATYSETVWQGAGLLVAYCLGLGLPFVATALAYGQVTGQLRRMRRWTPLFSRVGAVFIILVGLLMLTNTFARVAGLFTWGLL